MASYILCDVSHKVLFMWPKFREHPCYVQNRPKAAVAEEEEAKEGAAAGRPRRGWKKRRDRRASGPEQGSLVRDFPVFISTRKPFHTIFLPHPFQDREWDAVWEFDPQPRLNLSGPVNFICGGSLRVSQEKGNKTAPSIEWHLLWMLV